MELERDASLARIAKDELASLDWILAGQRIDGTALNGRLTDQVPEAERIEATRLRSEILRMNDGHA